MFDRREPKIFYNAKLLRVMIALRKVDVLAHEVPPLMLLEKTEARLLKEQRAGKIGPFEIFATRLYALWQRMRKEADDNDQIVLTLASATPPGAELFLEKTISPQGTVQLTVIDPQKKWPRLSLGTFKFTLRHALKQAKIGGVFDPAAIHYAYIRLVSAGLLTDFPLATLNLAAKANAQGRAFRLSAGQGEHTVTLTLFEPQFFKSAQAREGLFRDLEGYADEIFSPQKAGPAVILHKHLTRTLTAAMHGPERFGLDLPTVMLAAYLPGDDHAEGERLLGVTLPKGRPPTKEPTRPCPFRVTITKGGMEAVVSVVSGQLVAADLRLDEVWWRDYLHRSGVVHGIDWRALEAFFLQLAKGGAVTEQIIARASRPQPARDPDLLMIAGNAALRKSDPLATHDFRYEASRDTFARAGEVVAKVVYQHEPLYGLNVRGEKIVPPPPEPLDITTGEGIARNGDSFTALIDGALQHCDGSIWLDPLLVIKGDVNLTSGDIHFAGPIEIMGNVETGASIEAGGELLIHGMVATSHIFAHKGVQVKGGIIGGGQAILRIRGDLTAHFIENAQVISHGSIQVERGIVGGMIACQGRIEAKGDNGMITGAEIHCWQELYCRHLGRTEGVVTKINMGRDFLWQMALNRRLARLASLKAAIADTRAMLKVIQLRTAVQLTKTQQKMRPGLTERLANLFTLQEKLQRHAELARARIRINADAKIHVIGTLNKNCQLLMGETHVPVPGDIQTVTVLTTKVRGEHFIPLVDEQLVYPNR